MPTAPSTPPTGAQLRQDLNHAAVEFNARIINLKNTNSADPAIQSLTTLQSEGGYVDDPSAHAALYHLTSARGVMAAGDTRDEVVQLWQVANNLRSADNIMDRGPSLSVKDRSYLNDLIVNAEGFLL